jgi:hypothetical protein
MWNLPRRAVEELVDGHRLPMDIDTLWRLTGGNLELFSGLIKGLDQWFKAEVLKAIYILFEEIQAVYGGKKAA